MLVFLCGIVFIINILLKPQGINLRAKVVGFKGLKIKPILGAFTLLLFQDIQIHAHQ